MRIGKIVTISSGVTTNYRYAYEGGLLHKMTRGERILEFSHDTNGTLLNLKDAVLRTRNTASLILIMIEENFLGLMDNTFIC